jgi:EAL domain-containing protein (putative c-di-GMP-specific phosphodiesterase class I)/GGDEF domain-containing protein
MTHAQQPPVGGRFTRVRTIYSVVKARRLWDTPPPVATDRTLSTFSAACYLSGGGMAVLLVTFEGDIRHRGWIVGLAAVALANGLVVARFPTSIPPLIRRLMNVGGTGLILSGVLLSAPSTGAEAFFWLFCYIPLDSFIFFPWRLAVPMQMWGFAATGIAVFVGHVYAPETWYMVIVVMVVMSIAIGLLIRSAAEAEWDPATGMLSRRGFDRELSARCEAGRDGSTFSLAVVSIDSVEHLAGPTGVSATESLMRRLAADWSAMSASRAMWARVNDRQLAILWDHSPGFDAYLERVRATASNVNTVSIGVADSQPEDTPVQMMTKALVGLSYSERNGGDRMTRQGLVANKVDELRRAIEAGDIAVYYQPIVDIHDGRLRGAEALARWIHPVRGVIGPEEFIGLAEEAGLIGALGEGVLRQACRGAARWRCDGTGQGKVTVNVSAYQLRDPHFVGLVSDCLEESGLDPHRLVLEVTESVVGGEDPAAVAILQRLRRLGVRVAIDDFGTGYSNLSRLAGMPVDMLKLDRSFIVGIETSARTRALVRGLIGMAAGLDLLTVAEGIETPEQALAVQALGCEEAQGWLWGRPVPQTDFALDRAEPAAS